MKTINTEAKSMLAKLLAVENITVQHNNVHTATFDVESRVLTLPKWDKMTNDVYDMLVGHEVGHALFSPVGQDSIIDAIGKIESNASDQTKMDYLNVVEDARIEKMMQAKYPGLGRDFYLGYDWLMNRNFFGIMDKDVDTLPLIDRVNIHFKMRGKVQVNFTEEEMMVIDQIATAKTFDDVIDATNALIAMSSSHNNESQNQMGSFVEDFGVGSGSGDTNDGDTNGNSDGNGSDNSGNSDDNGSDNSGNSNSGNSNSGNSNSGNSNSGNSNSGNSNSGNSNSGNSIEGDVDTVGNSGTNENGLAQTGNEQSLDRGFGDNSKNDVPESVTQKNLADAFEKMSGYDDNGATIEYRDVDPIDLTNRIMKYGDLTNTIDKNLEDRKDSGNLISDSADFVAFMSESKSVVAKMVQDFEMKKAAEESRREMTSKSGVLDTNKMVGYKWSEDIFLSNTIVNEGKSHGVIVFLDWSSSMDIIMVETIKQMLTIAMFCKKVSIPFEVYAFSDSFELARYLGNESGGCSLINLISTKAKNTEWNKMLKNCFHLGKDVNRFRHRLPTKLLTHSTPLNQSIVLAKSIIEQFRTENGSDIITPIFLTDGCASDTAINFANGINLGNGFSVRIGSGEGALSETDALLKWLSVNTGCKICGISIVDNRDYIYAANKNKADVDSPFIVSKDSNGYDHHISVSMNQKVTGKKLEDLNEKSNAKTIANAVMRSHKANRVMTSVMISVVDKISSNLF